MLGVTAVAEDAPTIIPPQFYRSTEDGRVILQALDGRSVTLAEGQFVILQDGLLLVTDEVAQNTLNSLPILGSFRASEFEFLEPVISSSGSIVETDQNQPVWSGERQPFQSMDLQTYEFAQDLSAETTEAASDLLHSGLGVGAAVSLSAIVAALFSLLSNDEEHEEMGTDAGNISSPAFTSGTTANFAENGTGTVYTAAATDADGDTPTYHLIGGADQALFDIDRSSGALTFKSAPDYEDPTDSGGNNVYEVEIEAKDGNGGSATQTVMISVTNMDDGLNETFPNYFATGQTKVVNGTVESDTLIFGDYVASGTVAGSNLSVAGLGGDDNFTFGRGAANGTGSDGPNGQMLEITNGDGDQNYIFGDLAASNFGSLTINTGDGSQSFTFGENSASNRGSIYIQTGNGDKIFSFGKKTAWSNGIL